MQAIVSEQPGIALTWLTGSHIGAIQYELGKKHSPFIYEEFINSLRIWTSDPEHNWPSTMCRTARCEITVLGQMLRSQCLLLRDPRRRKGSFPSGC